MAMYISHLSQEQMTMLYIDIDTGIDKYQTGYIAKSSTDAISA